MAPTLVDLIKAGIEAQQPKDIFDRILAGIGSGVAIGGGISQLINPPSQTVTRQIPSPTPTEQRAVATTEALNRALLSDVGLNLTDVPGGVQLTPKLPTSQDLANVGITSKAQSAVLGRRTLSPQARQQLISQIQGRLGGGGGAGIGGGGGIGTPGAFSGSFTGLEIGANAGGGGTVRNGASGSQIALPAIGAALGLALPIARELGLFGAAKNALGLGNKTTQAAPPTPPVSPAAVPATTTITSPTDADFIGSMPPVESSGVRLSPSSITEKTLSPYDIDFIGSMPPSPPSITAPSDIDLTGSIPPTAFSGAAPTDIDFIGSMPPTQGGTLGLNLGTALPALGLAGGIAGLALGDPGQKAAGGITAAASGLNLAGQAGLVAPSTAALSTPLGLLALVPGIASLFGAFKGPNRSQTFNRSVELDIRPAAEKYLGAGGLTSNLGDGGVGNLYQALDSGVGEGGLNRAGAELVKSYLGTWESAAKEVGSQMGTGGDADRAAAAILTSIFTKSMEPDKVASFLASLGASAETMDKALSIASPIYNQNRDSLNKAWSVYSTFMWNPMPRQAEFQDALADSSPNSLDIARRVGPETLRQWGYELIEDPDNPRGGYLRPLNYQEGQE